VPPLYFAILNHHRYLRKPALWVLTNSGKLNLVDLVGTEDAIAKSGSIGERASESINISISPCFI